MANQTNTAPEQTRTDAVISTRGIASELSRLLASMTPPQRVELRRVVDAYKRTVGSYDWPHGMSLKLRTGKRLAALGLVINCRSNANGYDHWRAIEEGVNAAELLAQLTEPTGERNMPNITDRELEKLNTPGLVVEVDRKTAEELGAFEEDALSEEDALAATEETSPAGTANDGSKS